MPSYERYFVRRIVYGFTGTSLGYGATQCLVDTPSMTPDIPLIRARKFNSGMGIPTAIEKLSRLLMRNTCEAKPAGEWTLSLWET